MATTSDSVAENRVAELAGTLKPSVSTGPSPEILKYRELAGANSVVMIAPRRIEVDENIRRDIGAKTKEFQQLKDSIKRFGVLQSLVVEFREISDSEYKLVCVAGHRRLAALKQLKTKAKVPVRLVQPKKPGDTRELAISENVNRSALHFIELADVLEYLVNENGLSAAELADRYSRDEKTIKRYLKIAQWPPKAKELVLANKDLFQVSWVMQHIAQKNLTPSAILLIVNRRLQAHGKKVNKPTRVSLKERRGSKLKVFFKEKDLDADQQRLVTDAMSFLGLL